MDVVLIVIPLLVIVPSSLTYPIPYAWFLASCSIDSHMSLPLFLDLAFPSYFQSLRILPGLPLAEIALGFCGPLLSRVFSH